MLPNDIRRRERNTPPHSNSGTRSPCVYSLWHEGGDISPETAAIGISAARNSVFRGRRCRDLLCRGSRNICLPEHVPEKWKPVFRKGHATEQESRAHPNSVESGCALALRAACAGVEQVPQTGCRHTPRSQRGAFPPYPRTVPIAKDDKPLLASALRLGARVSDHAASADAPGEFMLDRARLARRILAGSSPQSWGCPRPKPASYVAWGEGLWGQFCHFGRGSCLTTPIPASWVRPSTPPVKNFAMLGSRRSRANSWPRESSTRLAPANET